MEVNTCRKEQPFVIKPHTETSHELDHEEGVDHSPQGAAASQQENTGNMDLEIADTDPSTSSNNGNDTTNAMPKQTKPCLPQRAALLKSMLNFLKKAIQDPSFSDSIRHVMDGSLPSSLKHIISNAEYYGPSLFLLATDVVTVYVFQEPSLLSFLQDNGLTDVVLHALLVKEVS
jgi:E3 ubiquitin-protein ligase HUWE1